ncbi:type I-E CRISPR-associated protein Cse2/CasB [Streptomyces purpureus]|uniref:type I-E CRISPR-associated protein Cse2/CasB n=1 Tax=Streptomyces purpureus TaxID=1951 RepID=UPI000997FEC8|nr:type I-E CRISPR-associated protein Cse2/CasB [Streptomyces purpureus]
MSHSTHELSSSPHHPASPGARRHDNLTAYDTFATRVRQACTHPGTQQALRAALARPLDEVPARTHAALLRQGLVPDRAGNADKRAYYAIAALIAARPRAERRADADDLHAADGHDEGDSDTTQPADDPGALARQSQPAGAAGLQLSWGTSLGEAMAELTARRARAAVPQEGDAKRPPANKDKINGVEQRLHLLVRQDIEELHRMLPAVARQLGSAGVPLDYGRLLHDLLRWPRRRDDTARRWLEDFYRTLRRSDRPA